jgi:hypothetical protein
MIAFLSHWELMELQGQTQPADPGQSLVLGLIRLAAHALGVEGRLADRICMQLLGIHRERMFSSLQ